MASSDYFLKIDGIVGESGDAKHKGEIEISSFSWGASQSGSFASGGGGGAGKVSMQDFHFVMSTNSASPHLFISCASGKHIKKATLACRKAGGDQNEFLIVDFEDIQISSFQTGGSSHGDVLPTDQISLNFAKVVIEYKEQKTDGGVVSKGKVGWDLKKNVKV